MAWPTGLPSPLAESDPVYELQDNAIRTKPEVGPAKVRRRFSGKCETMSFSLNLTKAQRAIFQVFYWTTQQEVLPFDWVDFRVYNMPAVYRFAKPPKETYVAGDATTSATSQAYWKVDIELEKIS